jgi:subtilisin family serine protease
VRFALGQGAVIVAAGGTDGPGTGTGPFYPASYPYPGVLSVGAVESDGSLAPFSDQGSNVAVTAPGVDVTSAWPGGFQDATLSGTSFAAAFVSGVAALVRSRFPRLGGAAVVKRIEVTANGGTGPGTGDGLVNPLEAVTAILPSDAAPSPPPSARSAASAPDRTDHRVRPITSPVPRAAVPAERRDRLRPAAPAAGEPRDRLLPAGRAPVAAAVACPCSPAHPPVAARAACPPGKGPAARAWPVRVRAVTA